MRMWELHKAIEDLGLREHGDKEVVLDFNGRYLKVVDIRSLNNDEVILRVK